jgi:quinoprotein glucose dehydrogenase
MKGSFLRTLSLTAAVAAVLSLHFNVHAQASQSNADKSVWNGVFSEDQAQRGRLSYNKSCAGCHRPDLSGFEGVLSGQKFMDHWGEDSLDSLYSNIKKSMPRNEPGSLDSATYVDIISYVLQQNGFPSGESELNADSLKNIQVIGRDGPGELPNGALIQVYGCIKEDPANTWTLRTATKAIRTRNPDKSSDEALKTAETKLPGKSTYRLIDAAFYHPERHKDHAVEVKGFLVADPTPGINPTALSALSTTCQ